MNERPIGCKVVKLVSVKTIRLASCLLLGRKRRVEVSVLSQFYLCHSSRCLCCAMNPDSAEMSIL